MFTLDPTNSRRRDEIILFSEPAPGHGSRRRAAGPARARTEGENTDATPRTVYRLVCAPQLRRVHRNVKILVPSLDLNYYNVSKQTLTFKRTI